MAQLQDDAPEVSPLGIADDATILMKRCDLIAPMTRIRGTLKLTDSNISFVPDREQPTNSKNEINLAQNPPPLPASKSTSPRSLMHRPLMTQTINSFKHLDSVQPSTPTLKYNSSKEDNETEAHPPLKQHCSSNRSTLTTEAMVLGPLDSQVNTDKVKSSTPTYWIAANVWYVLIHYIHEMEMKQVDSD